MMNRYNFSLFLFLILSLNSLYGQTNKDNSIVVKGETITGKISVDHYNKFISIKTNGKKETFQLADVSYVNLEGKEYTAKPTLNAGSALLTEVVSGNATLYRDLNENIFLETEKNDLRKLNLNKINYIRGELLRYFSECLPVRNEINNLNRITSRTVIELTERYNECNYSQEFSLSAEELKEAEPTVKDAFSIYLGAGYSTTSLHLEPGGEKISTGNLMLNAGIKFVPGFLRRIQNNFFFTANIDYLPETERTFTISSIESVKIGTSAVKTLAGINYVFNKNNSLRPYLGVSGGTIFAKYDLEYNSSMEEKEINIDSTIDKLMFSAEPELGLFFDLSEKGTLNLALRYHLKQRSQLNSDRTFSIPMTLEETGFSTTLRYIFH